MSLRRLVPFALALGAVACAPSLPGNTNPQYVDYAVFDLATGSIPVPNDLILGNAASVPGAQGELLRSFAANGCSGSAAFPACGGWPSDQEVPITVGFIRVKVEGGGVTAPDLDVSSFSWCPGPSCNALLMEIPPGAGALPARVDPALIKVEYAPGASGGTLSIRHWDPAKSAYRPWNAGSRYVVALRGGASGLKTASGVLVEPQPAMYLLLQDKDLSLPANQGLLPGTPAEKAAAGAQLEQIRELYAMPQGGALLSIFGLVDSQFPHREIAALASFNIVGGTYVVVDPASGNVPIPFDLILDPTTGKVANNPGFCQGVFDRTNPPSCPLSRGLATLDGFSTTALVVAPLSGPVVASSVNKGTVLLYDLTNPAAPALVPDATQAGGKYVTQPPALVQSGASAAIGLQPAVPVPIPSSASPSAFLALPPLKEGTEYGVVITDGVKDATAAQAGLVRSTFANILVGTESPLYLGSQSLITGLPLEEAAGIQAMRTLLGGVFASLPAGVTKANVKMAYTFKTQSITGRLATTAFGGKGDPGAVQLAAFPYDPTTAGALCAGAGVNCQLPVQGASVTKVYTPGGGAGSTVADAFAKYGVDITGTGAGAPTNVGIVIESKIYTYNLISPGTGAFSKPLTPTLIPIDVLIAAPAHTGPTPIPVPLVVYHHGLGDARADMLTVAQSFAAAGMAVAAIDAPLQGDRSYCSAIHLFQNGPPSATNPPVTADKCTPTAPCTNYPMVECAGAGSTCVPDPTLAGQGDVAPALPPGALTNGPLPSAAPGHCMNGANPAPFVYKPALCDNAGCLALWAGTAGVPVASGEYLVSSNFFRTRDSMRQDIVDFSQLVLVLTPNPLSPPAPGTNAVFDGLASVFTVLDPTKVYWASQSFGSILGTMNTAANPRFSRAAFNVGGGTVFDVFTSSPSYAAQLNALLLSLGIDRSKLSTDPAMAQKYLLISSVAKWILDPADPINFAGHVAGDPLPNLLPPLGGAVDGSVAQSAKLALTQIADCDQTVPNPFSALLDGDILATPVAIPAVPAAPGVSTATSDVQWFFDLNGPAVPDVYPGSGCAAGQRVPHGFFTRWGVGLPAGTDRNSVQALTGLAQSHAATFLSGTGAAQPAVVAQ